MSANMTSSIALARVKARPKTKSAGAAETTSLLALADEAID
jgi:hypothetical protein